MKRILSIAAALIAVCTVALAEPQSVYDSGTFTNVPLTLPSTAKTLSAASTNATNVTTVSAILQQIYATNTGASAMYLKLIDKGSSPTCGTDPVKMTISLPVNQPIQFWPPVGVKFTNGISFCITGALADADTTAAVVGAVVNVMYQ